MLMAICVSWHHQLWTGGFYWSKLYGLHALAGSDSSISYQFLCSRLTSNHCL